MKNRSRKYILTLQEVRGEIDTDVPIPRPLSPLLHHHRQPRRFHFLQSLQDPVSAAEPDDNLGDAEEEGLGPEFEEFALVLEDVVFGVRGGGGLELDPIDGVDGGGGRGRFGVPDCPVRLIASGE